MKRISVLLLTGVAVLGMAIPTAFAQPVTVVNTAAAVGLPSYDFGPVTISAFYGETEVAPNSAINSGLSFIGVNSGDGNVNSINDTDGVSGGADQERLRLEIEAGYYLTNMVFQWTRAGGPLTNDGVRISGFASDPGAVFAGGAAVSNVRYTNGTLAFNVAWTAGTQYTASFTNNYSASAGGTLEITVADSSNPGPVIAVNSFTFAPVPPPTPAIIRQPTPVTRYVGYGTNIFAVSAIGDGTLGYQWYKAPSTPVADATNSSLTIPNLALGDAGSYYVVVTNFTLATSTTSDTAALTVITPTLGTYEYATITSHPLIYHRYSDVSTSTNVVNQGTLGALGDGNLFGFYSPGSGPQPPEYPNFEVSNPAPFLDGFSANGNIPPLGSLPEGATITAWINLSGPQLPFTGIVYNRSAQGGSGLFIKKDSTATYDVLGYAWNGARFGITNDTLALPQGTWAFVALVVEPTQATLYVQDGTNMITQVDTFNHAGDNWSSTTRVGWDSNGGLTGRRFLGTIDEVTIHGRALSASEVLTLFAASSNYPPTIVISPQDTTNYTGLPFSLAVGAQGTPPMSYQWHKMGSGPVSGATNDTYAVATATLADAGGYFAVVTNSLGSATSGVANVTVVAQPPILTSLPQSSTNWLGLNASFSVAAEGSVPFSYLWSKTGSGALPGETNTSLVLTGLTAGDIGSYFVTVTNPEGATNSPAASLLVLDPNTLDQWLYPTNGYVSLRSNFTGVIGTRFKMGDYDRTVTHLGFFDADSDGLGQPHSVGVYTAGNPAGSGVLLGEVLVPAGTSAGYTNGYRWVALGSPLTLTNGQSYTVACTAAANVDAWPSEGGWVPQWNEVFVGYTDATNRALYYTPSGVWPTEPATTVANFFNRAYAICNLMSTASAAPEVVLTIEKVGTDVRLTWPVGTLQAATVVNGAYTNVPSATSPYTIPPGGPQMFFRVQVN